MEKPFKNSFIERLENKDIPITWNFLLLGLVGPGLLPSQLSCKEIINYALTKTLKGSRNALIENIAYSEDNDRQLIETNLRLLSKEEDQKSKLTDLKKWELLFLEDLFENLSEDPIKGLTDLTSFWSQFDFPNDSPHVVQGRLNNISPENYYTQEHYQQLIKNHKEWIKKTELELSMV